MRYNCRCSSCIYRHMYVHELVFSVIYGDVACLQVACYEGVCKWIDMWGCSSASIAIAVLDPACMAGFCVILYKGNRGSTVCLRSLFLVLGGCLLFVVWYRKPIGSVLFSFHASCVRVNTLTMMKRQNTYINVVQECSIVSLLRRYSLGISMIRFILRRV
jgi:hypothetical protein